MSMPQLDENLNIKLCTWLYGKQGITQCVFKFEDQYYLLNQATGLRAATEEDRATNPELEAPDFLATA